MTSAVKRERVGQLVERDESERLSADDQATLREAEFLADALATQRMEAARSPVLLRGVCANCDAPCAPRAVYCDAACRGDHEARLAARRRGGRGE